MCLSIVNTVLNTSSTYLLHGSTLDQIMNKSKYALDLESGFFFLEIEEFTKLKSFSNKNYITTASNLSLPYGKGGLFHPVLPTLLVFFKTPFTSPPAIINAL